MNVASIINNREFSEGICTKRYDKNQFMAFTPTELEQFFNKLVITKQAEIEQECKNFVFYFISDADWEHYTETMEYSVEQVYLTKKEDEFQAFLWLIDSLYESDTDEDGNPDYLFNFDLLKEILWNRVLNK